MTRRFDVYAPLQDFYWPGEDFSFSPSLALKRINDAPDLSGLESNVSKLEWERATNSDHWLTFQWVDGVKPSPSEIINLVLLSLWLVKPIRSQVALKFEIGREDTADEKKMSRLLDRFAWISGTIDPDITDEDLRLASTYYSALEPLCRVRGRLNNAMVLTVAGVLVAWMADGANVSCCSGGDHLNVCNRARSDAPSRHLVRVLSGTRCAKSRCGIYGICQSLLRSLGHCSWANA